MVNPVKLLRSGLIVAACISLPQIALAQGSNLFGSSGTTRGGTGGISGSLTGSGFGGSGFGASGASGGRSGTTGLGGSSGFGNSGFGNSGFGNSGFGQSSGFGGTGTTGFGTTGANQGFVGRNSGAFAGNSQANATGNGGRGGAATRNFNNTGSRQGANGNQNQTTRTERTTSSIRPRQRVAFDYNTKSPTVVATNVGTRLAKIAKKNPKLNGVSVQVDGGELVLTGKVKTEDQSRLATILLRQEPGVTSVRNELIVEEPAVEQ